MTTSIRVSVGRLFVTDWLDLCEGESVRTEEDPWGTRCDIVKTSARTLTVDIGPAALRDLVSRADYYRVEEFDDPATKALQRSAVTLLKRLEKAGFVEKVRASHGGTDYRVKGQA